MSSKNKTIFICFAAAMGGLLFGFDTAVISGTIEPVKRQFNMSAATEGWFVSSGLLGCIIGVIVAGLISDKLGRKKALILSAIFFLCSGIICAFSAHVDSLFIGRLVGGLGVGIVSVAAPMFITEFAPSKIRGSMVAIYQLAITIGIIMAYLSNALILSLSLNGVAVLGLFNSQEVWRSMFIMMGLPSVIFFVLMLLVPESPRWLLSKNKIDEAKRILSVVREPELAESEYHSIISSSKTQQLSVRSVLSKAVRLPLMIGILLAVFQQFCGINAIMYYGPKLFETAGLTTGNALQTQIIIGAVNVVFTFFAIFKADKFGRRALLISGITGIIISLTTVGFCFYSGNTEGILLVSFILLFVACFAFSLGPMTWVLINEIFPNDLRVKAVSICTLAVWLSAGLIGQFFPIALEAMGPAAVFWIFAGVSCINLLFCLKIVKETKGQSLEDIEAVYAGKA